MRRLPATQVDSLAFHHAIVNSKQSSRRARLNAARDVVENRIGELVSLGPFDLLRDNLGHTCDEPACADCLIDDLKSLWDSSTKPLIDLKQALLDEFSSTKIADCPYCGTDPAEGYDHYLPRDAFPEFSVTAINLFRACDMCNTLKGPGTPTDSDRFLHPTIDPLDQPILRCTIDSSGGIPWPDFSIDVDAAASVGIKAEALFHFEKLRLRDRFLQASTPYLSSFLNELEFRGLGLGEAAAKAAEDRARSHNKIWGPNRWSTQLYFALADWIASSGRGGVTRKPPRPVRRNVQLRGT